VIPVVVFWTNYTATVRGRVLKLVQCENCPTEYVYVLDREGVGVGTSVYGLYAEAAADNAESGAQDALGQYLANDFDPIPCPTCGHYQTFMFPKLIENRSPWAPLAVAATLVVGVLSLVGVMYWGVNYLERPSNYALTRLGMAASILVVAGLTEAGMSAAERNRVRRFDPNAEEDQPTRVAKGRSRAMTRADFEAMQPPAKELPAVGD
jgi:hypothetical protein